MTYVLLRSSAFIREGKKRIKKQPSIVQSLQDTLNLLSQDPFHPRLRTHKLKGELKNSWSCSAGYDLRIIVSFVEYDNKQAILFESIGTHDEVY